MPASPESLSSIKVTMFGLLVKVGKVSGKCSGCRAQESTAASLSPHYWHKVHAADPCKETLLIIEKYSPNQIISEISWWISAGPQVACRLQCGHTWTHWWIHNLNELLEGSRNFQRWAGWRREVIKACSWELSLVFTLYCLSLLPVWLKMSNLLWDRLPDHVLPQGAGEKRLENVTRWTELVRELVKRFSS